MMWYLVFLAWLVVVVLSLVFVSIAKREPPKEIPRTDQAGTITHLKHAERLRVSKVRRASS